MMDALIRNAPKTNAILIGDNNTMYFDDASHVILTEFQFNIINHIRRLRFGRIRYDALIQTLSMQKYKRPHFAMR